MFRRFISRVFSWIACLKGPNYIASKKCLFVEAFPSPAFWMDEHKVYQGCNQLFADIIGLNKPSDIVGLTDRDLPFSLEILAQREEIFEGILKNEIPIGVLYDHIPGPQGKSVWTQKRFTPLKDARGRVVGILGILKDISEQVNRRQQIEATVKIRQETEELLQNLNKVSVFSPKCRKLAEKSLIIVKDMAKAQGAIWLKADALFSKEVCYFSTDTVDTLELFEKRKIFLKEESPQGYLDPILVNLLKDVCPGMESVFYRRIISKVFPKVNDIILIINPDPETLRTVFSRLELCHHSIYYFHLHEALKNIKKNSSNPPRFSPDKNINKKK